MKSIVSIFRVIALALFAVGIWALGKYGQAMPTPAPVDAPAIQFSAARAEKVLAQILGPQRPHPVSTAENVAVRARVIAEFERLGVTATPYTAMGCNVARRIARMACATVTDVVAPVLPGPGRAIVLLAHYDSVPAGPGAADDGSGVATVLETARALRAELHGAKARHPVIAVLTDGEEYGMLGAAAFLDDPQLRRRVGIVINAEARGNQGPSRLFQTSPGDKKLIDLYTDHVPVYSTSSLYAEIYKFLPNDTDLTLFLRDGFAGFNFAFIGHVADYHSPLDVRRNLSQATLQMHGDNVLGVARGLEQTSYGSLNGPDAIYLDVLGRWLPRLPQSWALPLAGAMLLLVAIAVALSRDGQAGVGEWLRAAAIFPALVIGTTLLGWLLVLIAQLVSGMPDPSYAHPAALRVALALDVGVMTLTVSRFAHTGAATAAVWLWLATLGLAAAVFLPGISPYFLLPLAFAAVLLLLTARFGWSSGIGQGALLLSAAAALVVWLQFTAATEMLMGLRMFPLFTIPAAVGAATLVPLLCARPLSRRAWHYVAAGCLAASVGAAVVAGRLPVYSARAPQRLNLIYVENATTRRATWAAETGAPLPPPLAAAENFSPTPQLFYPGAFRDAYVAPAGRPRLAAPGAELLVNTRLTGKRRITLGLSGSSDAAMMTLIVPGTAGLTQVVLGQKAIAVPPSWKAQKRIVISCMSDDCAAMPVTLDMTDTGAFTLTLIEQRAGLPDFGAELLATRPDTAMPSQFGDRTLLVARLNVPGT